MPDLSASVRHLSLLVTALLFCGLAAVPRPSMADEVDVALILAVDISYSMDEDELKLQRQGFVDALTSPEVLGAIEAGLIGKIALSYMEWAGRTTQDVLVDWHIIDGKAAAQAFAAELSQMPVRRRFRTAVGDALVYATAHFENLQHTPLRKVIDVSGDGPNNQGSLAPEARDFAISRGVVVNGLPLMMKQHDAGWFGIEDLDRYYAACVIGGPGSFLIPVRDLRDYGRAIRSKLVLEIAGLTPAPTPARVIPATAGINPYCLVGERLWRRRMINQEP